MPHLTTKNTTHRPAMASVSNKQKMLMQSLTNFFTASRHPYAQQSYHPQSALFGPKTSSAGTVTGTKTMKSPRSGGALTGTTTSNSATVPSSAATYTNNPYVEQLLQQVSKGAPISLRVIDWFVTNYSREHDVVYTHPRTGRRFNVHESYKSQLKAYSKRQFDPFCRRNRINFYYSEDAMIQTTVGQLNFFRWAIENHVLDYVRTHLQDIEKAMRSFVRVQRDEKREGMVGGGGSGGSGGHSGSESGTPRKGHHKTRRRQGGHGNTGKSGTGGGTGGRTGGTGGGTGGGSGGGTGGGSGGDGMSGCGASVHPGYIYTSRTPVTVDFS